MKFTSFFFLFLLCFSFNQNLLGQIHSLEINIANQPAEYVKLESISGDNFTVLDSMLPKNGSVQFTFPATAHTGIYRLVFGKTAYAKVMNEDPQMLDFIFNKENIKLSTDFKNPLKAAHVISSDENRLYFDFLIRLQEYDKLLGIMEQEIDSYWLKKDSAKAVSAANEFNRLQLDWDLRAAQTIQQNNSLFASKLIEWKRTPIKDAFLSPKERKENFRNEFLQSLDFSDESLIYSTAYTDRLFDYLKLYNQPEFNRRQRTDAYVKAVDSILLKTNKIEAVHTFVVNYLLHGFQVLGMKEVIDHINKTH